MLSYEQARKKVIEQVGKKKGPRAIASVSVWDALGLVLAQDVKTDREYPPFDRSTRDGYAVRSNEVSPGAQRKCAGEIKAGDVVRESLAEGTCWQIMTGAAVPSGADAVVMIEHSSREGDFVRFERAAQRGLKEDALVLSGGISLGKYDLVEGVLEAVGAEFFFDAVAIRPGKPAVFGMCQGKPVFGLPGNPVSTMVTFELFVTPAIDLLSGAEARELPLVEARLAAPLNEKSGLTHFLPARVEWREPGPEVKAIRWPGSGDIAALASANCLLVVPTDREKIEVGESVFVLLRKDVV